MTTKYLLQNIPQRITATTGSVAQYMYTYITGTTTNKTAYTDQAGAVPHTNPIVAAADGSFAQVWLSNDTEYRIKVVAADGTTIFTWDDISGDGGGVDAALRVDLALSNDATKGAGMSGFGQSLSYVANTIGWAERIAHSGAYNALIQVTPSQWAAILAGTSTDDHTTAIVAAAAAANTAGKPLFLPAGKWNFKPTTVLEIKRLLGSGKTFTNLYVDGSAYAVGKVALRNTGDTWEDIAIWETSFDKTRTILVQSAPASSTNQVGGDNTHDFVGYACYKNVYIFGGLIALDIGNAFNCSYENMRIGLAGTGVNCTPAGSGSLGLANTQNFINCDIADSNKNINANLTTIGRGWTFKGGAIERALVSSSLFQNIDGLIFDGVYQEQVVAISPITIVACTGVYAKFVLSGSNCDLTLGTNVQIEIDGWNSGSNHLLASDSTGIVSIRNSTFPSSGNAAPSSFAHFRAENSFYSGVFYPDSPRALALIIDSVTYSATMALNCALGSAKLVIVTDGNAMTFSTPTNTVNGTAYTIPTGFDMEITVKNASGGAMGAITWPANFKMAAWTNPANGNSRSIKLRYDGTNFVEKCRTTADIPN